MLKPLNAKTMTKISSNAQQVLDQINPATTKLGDLRTMAKDIKKDHPLAMELWSTGGFLARQLAILIMDKKLLSTELIDQLIADMANHPKDEKYQLMDWLMANQLSKEKHTIAFMESWEDNPSAFKRRIFWYYQARLRWTGQTPPPNTEKLLLSLEKEMEKEAPEVQWAMNYAAAQIGIFQPEYRDRCIALGERLGLYKDEVVPRGCAPSYLPALIAVQVGKLKK